MDQNFEITLTLQQSATADSSDVATIDLIITALYAVDLW